MNKGFIFSFSDMRTPTAAFNHRPKNLFGVILAEGGADGGGDSAADGGGDAAADGSGDAAADGGGGAAADGGGGAAADGCGDAAADGGGGAAADGGGDAAADGGGNETFSLELMVNVVDMDDTRISSDSDSDWEPPNAKLPERGGPSAAPVDPAAVLARFREQVRNTMTPRGRAEKRGIGSYFVLLLF